MRSYFVTLAVIPWALSLVGLFLALSVAPAPAQWTDPGEDGSGSIYYDGGNVGIGTTDPSARLSVSEDGGTVRFGNLTTGCCGSSQIPEGDFRGLIAGWDTDYAFFGLRDYGDDRKDVVINNEQAGDDIRIQSAGVDRVFVDGSNGRMGVGTTSPNEKLSVAGNVLSEEVIVKPQDDWADFVFEENYDVPTLGEVSSFIDENGHLPDVPSAESVEKNGLRLGEMDATLLRKEEELTLYAIEQRAYADSLEHRLSVQKVRADSLSEQVHSLRKQLRRERRTREKQIERMREQMDRLRNDRSPKSNR